MKKASTLHRAYIEYVLETGHPPVSVTAFCKAEKLKEREFFERFGSLEGLEADIFAAMVVKVAAAVSAGEAWSEFGAKEKLLAFLYAFADESLEHRSFLLLRFPGKDCGKGMRRGLGRMRDAFVNFITPVLHEGREHGELACRGRVNDTYPDSLFLHLLAVIDFHLKDDSSGFERTDAFIEKTAQLAADLMGRQVLDSAIDLGRFLIQGRPSRSGGSSS